MGITTLPLPIPTSLINNLIHKLVDAFAKCGSFPVSGIRESPRGDPLTPFPLDRFYGDDGVHDLRGFPLRSLNALCRSDLD